MKCARCQSEEVNFTWNSSSFCEELNYKLPLCDSCCRWALTILFTHDPLLGSGLNKLVLKQSNTYDKTNT